MGSCSVDDPSLPLSLKLSILLLLLLLLFTLSFLWSTAQGHATSSSQDAHEWATSGLNRKQQRSVSTNDSDSLSESSVSGNRLDVALPLVNITIVHVPPPILDNFTELYPVTERTESIDLDPVLFKVLTADWLHRFANATHAQRPKCCSRDGAVDVI